MPSMQGRKVIEIASLRAACRDCSLQELCLPLGLDSDDVESLERIVRRRHPLKKGEQLYRLGDPFKSIYAVRTGVFKSTSLMEDGRAQIIGFYLPGELLGMDAINVDKHPCTAEALETSEVCEIPFAALEDLAHKLPSLQHQLLRIMSREMGRDEQALVMLGRMNAPERLATCLMSFSRRYAKLGGDPCRFRLGMSRQDLGDYLGLALETVSRLFARLQQDGMVKLEGRNITLSDPLRLGALANGSVGAPARHHEHA